MTFLEDYRFLTRMTDIDGHRRQQTQIHTYAQIFHPLVHFLNVHSFRAWCRPKPGIRNSILVSHMHSRDHHRNHLTYCFQGALTGSSTGSGGKTDTSCGDSKQELNLLCLNAWPWQASFLWVVKENLLKPKSWCFWSIHLTSQADQHKVLQFSSVQQS